MKTLLSAILVLLCAITLADGILPVQGQEAIALPVRPARISNGFAFNEYIIADVPIPIEEYEKNAIALPVRPNMAIPIEDYEKNAIALPVRPSPIAEPVRKTATGQTESKIAKVYCASSFYCKPCERLQGTIQASGIAKYVTINYSEPAWVPYYPYVVYTDGTDSDDGSHLKSIARSLRT